MFSDPIHLIIIFKWFKINGKRCFGLFLRTFVLIYLEH